MCLGCIWNNFGVTRALKYVPGTCDVIIVALISSGHIWTNHAWINPMLWFISILVCFSFCSIIIQYKKVLKIYSNSIWVPVMDYVYLISSGHYARPRRFHDIFLFEEDIHSKYIFRSCYIFIRHGIDNHLRLSFIPNLVFHDPCSTVPRR